MGARPVPGSTGRRAEGGGGGLRRFDHLAEYAAPGAYVIDEATGEYSEYEIPEATGTAIEWEEILAHPRLIVADFQSEYGLDLVALGNSLTWHRFALLTEGLLACQSRIWRRLTDDKKPDEEVSDE